MGWRSTDVKVERRRFVDAWLKGGSSVAGLARAFGISERVAHKTLRRFKEEGPAGLIDRSRARLAQQRVAPEMATLVIEARRRHPDWGPRKLRDWLHNKQPSLALPAASTMGSLLKRHGLVADLQRRRRERLMPTHPCVEANAPNDSWSMDYKGQFRTRDGRWCYPFTVTDNASRLILACKALDGPTLDDTWRELARVFRKHGLPHSIRSDNGSPFASHGLARISVMMVRLLRLGVLPDFIAPGQPQQNGRHERMHRTLKQATASPPAGNKAAQQRRFNAFVDEFNNERPHEALDGKAPRSVHVSSPRQMPGKLPKAEYDDGVVVRSVRQNGCFKWGSREVFLAEPLAGERVAFATLDDDIHLISFTTYPVAIFDALKGTVHAAGTTPQTGRKG